MSTSKGLREHLSSHLYSADEKLAQKEQILKSHYQSVPVLLEL